MATVAEASPATRNVVAGEQRVLLHGIRWELYAALRDCKESWSRKMTYDDGELEIVSSSAEHERGSHSAGNFIKEVAIGLDQVDAILSYASATWRREISKRGLEADACFYFDPAKIARFQGRHPELENDPMPDLVVEVEITSPLLDKLAIYAAMGVPEVWRYDGEVLRIVTLGDDGAYHPSHRSQFLPVSSAEAQHWIGLAKTMDLKAWTRRLRQWIREDLGEPSGLTRSNSFMATVTLEKPTGVGDRRMVLRGISWETYVRLNKEIGDHQATRLAFNRGVLELMSPSPLHERLKSLIRILVEEVATGLGMECESYGSTTWRREEAQRGLEPDDCFYFDPIKIAQFSGRVPDQPDDPLPDLAIEIDISSSEIDRPSIYASLGIPEVWRHDGDRLRIDQLPPDGMYRETLQSRFLPIRTEEILHFLDLARSMRQAALDFAVAGLGKGRVGGEINRLRSEKLVNVEMRKFHRFFTNAQPTRPNEFSKNATREGPLVSSWRGGERFANSLRERSKASVVPIFTKRSFCEDF